MSSVFSGLSEPSSKRRKTWNHGAISQLANEAKPLEVQFGNELNKFLTQLDANIRVRPHENKFHRHDLIIEHQDHSDKKVLIELECGKTQSQWCSSIEDNRKKWPMGLNVLSRKISEGQHYDIFIKHNVACNSFFAATYDMIKQYGKPARIYNHSLHFKTDSNVFAIPWTCVDEQLTIDGFCTDNWGILLNMIKTVFQHA